MDLPMRILYIDHLVFVAMDYNHRDSYRRKNRIADHGDQQDEVNNVNDNAKWTKITVQSSKRYVF